MTSKRSVYLCGSMEFVSETEGKEWRSIAERILNQNDVLTLNPYRRAHSFKAEEMKRIFELDLRDIRECDIVLANMSTMDKIPSHGTAQEMFYAHYVLKKPVIAFRPKLVRLHPFLESTSTEWVSTVEDACDLILKEYI
jgi:nucleoside 2-deoxyribosyltransferase